LCYAGHLDCLNYLLERGCELDDDTVKTTVMSGQLESLKVMVARGYPLKPFDMELVVGEGGRFTPDQLRCIEHLLDNGRPVKTNTLIMAARSGDLDTVRLFHTRGVPLWDGACVEEPEAEGEAEDGGRRDPMAWMVKLVRKQDLREKKIIAVRQPPEDPEVMWQALRYGWAMGAPVPPALEAAFTAKRAATRATLLCFRVAAKLSDAEETASEQGATWAAMGRVPPELIEKIVVHADFEIPDTLRRSLPTERSVMLPLPHPPYAVCMRDDPALVGAFLRWSMTDTFSRMAV
jgi:hypothetical protein